jgi:hypothetical protein
MVTTPQPHQHTGVLPITVVLMLLRHVRYMPIVVENYINIQHMEPFIVHWHLGILQENVTE